MAMKHFELWLDESGDFENDKIKYHQELVPSLVGGLLVRKGSFPSTDINHVLLVVVCIYIGRPKRIFNKKRNQKK